MPYRTLTVAMLLSCAAVACLDSAFAADRSRPNVLFLAIDDLRPELGCYGHAQIRTPHIDSLARRGLTFTRAYCQYAVCNPSRASLMTGLRPDSTGVLSNSTHFRQRVPDVVTLPQQFKQHGYHTQAFGKIYHGAFATAYMGSRMQDPRSWSAPLWVGSPRYYFTPHGEEIARRVYARNTGKQGTDLDGWTEAFVQALATEAPDVPDNALYDGQATDRALEALEAMRDRPFFLAVGYLKPHLPFVAPKRYWDLYDPATIALAENDFPPRDVPALALRNWELRTYYDIPKQGPLSPEQARHLRHGYYACVSFIDAQVGRLLDQLDRLGLSGNTIVVLWGDHGWHLGENSHWGKTTNFELSTRVPLIVCAPQAASAGQQTTALVELVDLYPTLCELAGLPLPAHLQGASFARLLDDPHQAGKPVALSQMARGNVMGYSMRTARYRFTVWRAPNQAQPTAIELYDHEHDPAENVNLARQPEHAALVEQLAGQLRTLWPLDKSVARD